MSDWYFTLKLLHILSSTVLFGTGIGTAFSMWAANRGRDPRVIAAVTRNVVLADWLFTTPAVIAQPLTGFALVYLLGYSLTSPWLLTSIALYGFVGACWFPVIGLQLRMRNLARHAVTNGEALLPAYDRYYRLWFLLGWPAFVGVIGIFALMVWKPILWG
jgi:uncharacterized membrane protein